MSAATANAIFDAFAEASRKLHAEDARRKEIAHLHEYSRPRCGNCDHWMKKSSCPYEARGGKPSMNSAPCGAFKRDRGAEASLAKLQTMLGVSA